MTGVGTNRRASAVTLRAARLDDSHRVWTWRNDVETRRASFDSAPILLPAHDTWFRESLDRADRRLYIVLADETENGVVRLDIAGREAEVSVHLAPGSRGRGIGTLALRAAADLAFATLDLERLEARVKSGNPASRRAFLNAGFVVDRDGDVIRLVKARP